MSFIDQLDRAIATLKTLRRPRKPARVARANAYAARLRAASSEGERDLVRAELAGLRRGGKGRTRASRSDWPAPHRLIPTGDAYADAIGRDTSLAGDLEALRQLGISRAVNPATGRVLLKLWRAARKHDRVGARAAYNELAGSDKYLVPQPVVNFIHAGGKRRFDPAQLAKGTAEELEHAATIKKIIARKLPVKQAAELIAKDHLTTSPHHYDRAEAVAVPRRRKGLKAPRLKLLHRSGKLRVYLVDSHKVRRQLPDWTMGGHGYVYFPQVPRNEVWIAEEVFDPERSLTTIHELNEYALMKRGMGYDEAHDLSTALEQEFRVGGRKDVAATLRRKLREAAS